MNKLFGLLGGLMFLGWVAGTCGCVTSERRAAQEIDFTPQIIQQTSDLLAADRELSQFPIKVDGFKGNMRLKGQVRTAAEKQRADRIVWTARGVKSVENDLKITPNAGRR
jgi:osmotically-inducible protein OsmY